MWFVNPGRLHWKKLIFSCKWLSVGDSCWIREWEIVSTFPFPPQDPSDLNCACPVHVARGPVSHMCTSPVVNRRTPLYWFLCSLCLLHFFTYLKMSVPRSLTPFMSAALCICSFLSAVVVVVYVSLAVLKLRKICLPLSPRFWD